MSYDSITNTFDEWARTGRDVGMEEGHGDAVLQVLEQLDIGSSERILDLGCGNGWATRLLAKAGAGTSAVGIDASQEMIKRAEELHSFTIRARYERGHFEELDFKDGHFDRVFSMEALYYSPDLDKALVEIHRVLKSGGEADIVINCFQEHALSRQWSELMGVDMNLLSEVEWSERFAAAGFEGVQTTRVIDRRGPGDEASFEPSRWCPDWQSRLDSHAAGSLWIRAGK
jgi:ubiquinone/menaquinone biosynthesis C-methylase UbiE